jgi:hypothetical protein
MKISIFAALLIPTIFLINPRILREKRNIILTISILCGILGIINLKSADWKKPNFDLLWFCPLYALALYNLMLLLFWKRKKRDPKKVHRELFYTGDVSLFADKFFGFVFLLLSILFPVILIINIGTPYNSQ